MTQDRTAIEDDCIDEVDHALNPIGRFLRHNAMHAGTTPMVLDEYGRCARCVRTWLLETERLARSSVPLS